MNQPDMSPEHLALKINRSLHRLPLVLEVLDEIHGSGGTYPGDHEMRNGAVQAVSSMIDNLRRIKPTPTTCTYSSEAVQIAREWLRGALPEKLLPAEIHGELSTVLRELIPTTDHR